MNDIEINHEKLMAILEHCFSLHEADELSNMLIDEGTTVEDIKKRMFEFNNSGE